MGSSPAKVCIPFSDNEAAGFYGAVRAPSGEGLEALPIDLAASRVRRLKTVGVLCAVCVIKGADMQLLPSSFRAMEVDLQLRPHELGLLALCQGVSCAVSGPIWGNLVDCGISRTNLLVVGISAWACCTTWLGFVNSFAWMAALRTLNGVALAMLHPVTQSFVVDLSNKNDRGFIFGCLSFCSNMGQVLASLFVTPMSNKAFAGLAGWRVALLFMGFLSLIMAVTVPPFLAEEPRTWKPGRLGIRREFSKLARFIMIPTFAVIVLQGVFGTIPGAAFSFTTMYFQYTGISDTMAALINAIRIIGDACGGLLGGILGDFMATLMPLYGRALTAQLSVVLCIPLVYLIFLELPRDESSITAYAGLLFLHGLLGSWVAPGCLCPMMTEIVPKRSLASAYAWEVAMVFASGHTLGPILVGSISQSLYGYKTNSDQVVDMPRHERFQNAEALGMSVFWTTAVPYTLCALILSFLYGTYPVDAQAATAVDRASSDSEASVQALHETALSASRRS